MATHGFGIIVHVVMLNEDWLTGGSIGMMDIPAPSLLGMNFGAEAAFYYVCVTVAGFVYFALNRIAHSRFGRGLVAISQDEEAARASGISVNVYTSKCFLVAAFTAGVAGGLYAYHSRYLNPNDFTFLKSIDILIMVVIGGLGSLPPGAALGAVIVVLAPELLRSSGELRLILFGLLVIVLMGTGNRGLAGLIADFVACRNPVASSSVRTGRAGDLMAALLALKALSRRFGGLVASSRGHGDSVGIGAWRYRAEWGGNDHPAQPRFRTPYGDVGRRALRQHRHHTLAGGTSGAHGNPPHVPESEALSRDERARERHGWNAWPNPLRALASAAADAGTAGGRTVDRTCSP